MTVFPSTSHGYSSKIKKLDSNVIKQAMIMNLIRTKPRRKSMTNMIQGGYVKTNSMYGRRKPTENDFKFIEQRQMDEVESLHTESTYLSTSEYNGNTGHRGITRIKEGILPQAEIQKPKPDIEKTVPRGRKPKEESPRMEVVYHVSRDEFCRNIHRIQPSMMNTVVPGAATLNAPPISIVHSKSENPKSGNKKLDRRRDSFISSQDDLSENSFVVTHNTLKVG
ncbi:hypothetical protein FO519_002921 [Halicephalobus sp. NKZ332]|nr:hypothetical protein FO519_002921 [Halicephalobus sp. NKZ332]